MDVFIPQFLPEAKFEHSDLLTDAPTHSKYAIRIYPTLVKFDEDGNELARRTSDLDIVGLVEFMKET